MCHGLDEESSELLISAFLFIFVGLAYFTQQCGNALYLIPNTSGL